MAFRLGYGDGFDCRYALRAVGHRGVLDLTLFVRVPALALVHPELFWHSVFHRAVVLASQFVVRNPPVLCGAFAVGGQFRFGVDRALRVVVFHPTDAAQVPYVHIQALEGDARGHDAVEFVGPYLGVEQAVAERWAVKHLGLTRCNDCVALYCCVVAPQGGGEQVSGEVVARQALQEGGTLGFWSSLRLFQLLFCGLHSGFEGGELGLADALDAQPQGGLRAGKRRGNSTA